MLSPIKLNVRVQSSVAITAALYLGFHTLVYASSISIPLSLLAFVPVVERISAHQILAACVVKLVRDTKFEGVPQKYAVNLANPTVISQSLLPKLVFYVIVSQNLRSVCLLVYHPVDLKWSHRV